MGAREMCPACSLYSRLAKRARTCNNIGIRRRSVLRWKGLILFIALISAGVATFWVGVARDNSAPAASAAAQASAPAVPVTEGQAETRDVPIWLSGIGSV